MLIPVINHSGIELSAMYKVNVHSTLWIEFTFTIQLNCKT